MIEVFPNANPSIIRFRKLYKLPCGSHVFIDEISDITVADRTKCGGKHLVAVMVRQGVQSQKVFSYEHDRPEAAQEKADVIAAAVNDYYRAQPLMGRG